MSSLRVGFAGAGFIAGLHAEALAGRPNVRIAAVHDANAAKAAEFAAKFGARAAPVFDALLSDIDALYVCTPNAFHAQMAAAALEAGLHVFCEKPMATSLDGARRVREAAGRASGVCQIGFNQRFAPVFRTLKKRIDAGDFTPRWAHIKMNRGELQNPHWVADVALTGGFLYETPIHLFDLMGWLFGPPREVVCRATQTCAEQLDDFAMLITFESGLTTTLCSSAHASWLFPFERVEVYGDHAAAVCEEMDRLTLQLSLDGEPETLDVSGAPMPERWGYAAGDEAFLAAVRGEGTPAAGTEDGLRAVELADACYRAAETGRPARLE